jgi:carbonic anhydrase/acetyltransferase-like protein (isoleucine patch superfamily)
MFNLGNNTVIQDRAHITRETTIGDYVFVGPNSVIQGANIGNRAFVGMGSTVRHATLENGSVVAGGAVILDNVTIKSNQLWAGNPAQYVRDVTPT